MRKYAFLKNPLKCNQSDYIYKITIYQTKNEGVFLFQYCSIDAIQCSFDQYYNDPRFQCKKPIKNGSLVQMYGDNVYHTDKSEKPKRENIILRVFPLETFQFSIVFKSFNNEHS